MGLRFFVKHVPRLKFQASAIFSTHILSKNMCSTIPISPDGISRQHLNDVFKGAENGTTVKREQRVRRLCNYYFDLDGESKVTFLRQLATNFSVNQDEIKQKAQLLLDITSSGSGKMLKLEDDLRESLKPKYITIFHEIGRFEGGVKFLVDLRCDILNLLAIMEMGSEALYHTKALNTAIKNLLALWFSVGFMQLQRVTWDSSCGMLQKVSEYEAVHPIRNWTDLKKRVGMYRRCYVFTHNSMPNEPIVVLHTALTNEISNSIQSIVAYQRQHSEGDITLNRKAMPKEDPKKVKAAVFYSITSTQKGLVGIELGNYLIKKVVKEVQTEFPLLKQFSTLSPIPGFKDWLLSELLRLEKGSSSFESVFSPEVMASISKQIESTNESIWTDLRRNIARNLWTQDVILQDLLSRPLLSLCAFYLCKEKRRGYALNSVANFHLKNGAVIWRLNWKGDWSPRGLTNSCGIMVNYRYYLEETELNSEQYLKEQFIKTSNHITDILPQNL